MEILTHRSSACKLSSKHSTTTPPRLEIKLQNQNMLKSHLVGMVGCVSCCWETGKLCPGNGLSRSNSAMMAAMSSSSLLDPSSSGLIWKSNRVKIHILEIRKHPKPEHFSVQISNGKMSCNCVCLNSRKGHQKNCEKNSNVKLLEN